MNCIKPYFAYLTGFKTKNGKEEYFIDFNRAQNELLELRLEKKDLYKFAKNKKFMKFDGHFYVKNGIPIPCGKCEGCLLDRKMKDKKRLIEEAKEHLFIYFVTLTYSEENYKTNDNECYRDLQLFFKRFRKYLDKLNIKIKYFAVKEKGEKTKRNHFHAIIYFDNEIENDFIEEIKSSILIKKCWKLGFEKTEKIYCKTGIEKIANYVAAYVLKKRDNQKLIKFYSKGLGLSENNIKYLEKHLKNYINGNVYNVDKVQRNKMSSECQEKLKNQARNYYKNEYKLEKDYINEIEKIKNKINTIIQKNKNNEKI